MSRRRSLPAPSAYQSDAVNVQAYRPEADGRNTAGERVTYVPLERLHASPYQTRIADDEAADESLRMDLDLHGIVHAPVVRPHPAKPGHWEVVAGHRRVQQSKKLAREGRGKRFLRGDPSKPDQRLLGVFIRDLDDLSAYSLTVAENLQRKDLRPWEQTRALGRHREMLREKGAASTVRAVAASIDENSSTVAPYLQVADALSSTVLQLTRQSVGEFGDIEMCAISLEGLLRAARAKTDGLKAARLARELTGVLGGPSMGASEPRSGFQVNIRTPLVELPPKRAVQVLERLLPAALTLAKRSDDQRYRSLTELLETLVVGEHS